MNFDKSTIGLNYLHIFFMLTKFHDDKKLIVMSSINCLNSSFSSLKLCIKDEFIDQMVNYIRLIWKQACILRIYRICDPTVGFSKYEFNNKLLGGVTWTQPSIS